MVEEIRSLPSVWERLARVNTPLLLYGMGDGAEKVQKQLNRLNISVSGVVASDAFARGNSFLSFRVMSFAEAEKAYGEFACVLCFGAERNELPEIFAHAEKHALFCPDIPVYGSELLTDGLLDSEKDVIERVYSLLCDERSKRIFRENLRFSRTGDHRCLTWEDGDFDFPGEFYAHSKCHIDVGAFDGDTATEYASKNNGYDTIYAFEPDVRSYAKLLSQTKNIRNCVCVNAAVGLRNAETGFSGSGRGAHAEGDGNTKTVSLDSFTRHTFVGANGIDVGSIKIDAEGMDSDVLCGGVNLIGDTRPAIAAAVYHTPADLWRIPDWLHKICGKYRLYIRRKPYLLPAWDTFAVAVL